MAIKPIEIKINAEVAGVKDVEALSKGTDELTDALTGLGSDQLNTALTSVSKAVAGLFALNKVKDFTLDTIALADAYGQMAARISYATPAAEEYEMVQQRILATANQTYRPLEEQQELYIRTADALRSMTYSTSEALDIQDSFSYLLTTNAASTERGKNAIDAYTKSIQSGNIAANSWQSIMAAMPTVVDAVATSTGKTAEEVRKLGVTGKLSINDLNEGLRKTVDLNRQVAAGMDATVSDAITRLTNTWQTYVGEANRANQSTQKIVGAIELLSDNLDLVISLSIKAGEVMAAVWGVKALNALKAYTAQLAVAAAETSSLMAATAGAAAKAGAAIAGAGAVGLAGWVGWEIGAFLKDEFEAVERAGIALAAGLTKTAAIAQAAWETIKAAFTDDTIMAAEQRLVEKIAQIDDAYAEMFANVGKGQARYVEDTKKAAAATEEAEKSALKYKEALEKATQSMEALRITRNADAQVALSGLRTQLELAKQSENMALLLGKEKDVRAAKILQMEIEIQISQAKTAVARAEAEGSINVANAKLAELKASGELTPVKEAEIQASIRIAQAKIAEADASGKAVDVLNKQLELFKKGATAAGGYTDSLGRAAKGQRDLAGATGEANIALQKQQELQRTRFSRPGEGSTQRGDENHYDPGRGSPYARPSDPKPVNGNGQTQEEFLRTEKLKGQGASDERLRFELLAKLQSGGLSPSDLEDLKTVVETLKVNEKIFADISPGLHSLEGLADDRKWANAATQFEQAIARFEGQAGVTSAGAAAVGRTVNVNLSINGQAYGEVPTTEAGSSALNSWVNELARARKSST